MESVRKEKWRKMEALGNSRFTEIYWREKIYATVRFKKRTPLRRRLER